MKSFTLLLLVIILSSLALAKSVELHLNNDGIYIIKYNFIKKYYFI